MNTDIPCDLCDKMFAKQESLQQHRRNIHGIRARSGKKYTQNPVVDYEQLVCISCELKLKTKGSLRNHLYLHKKTITMVPTPPPCNAGPELKSSSYQTVHSSPSNASPEPESLSSQSITSSKENTQENFCGLCNYKLNSPKLFLQHLKKVHATTSKVLPDINDPQFTCQSCNNTQYKNHRSYWNHLRRIHHMQLRPYKRNKPNKNNTPYFCKQCHCNYKNEKSFKYHLYTKHRYRHVTITKEQQPQPHLKPIMDDPNAYCQSCDRTFKSQKGYRQHVHASHKISLESFRKDVHKVAKPVPETSACIICRFCSKSSRNIVNYKYHLFCKHCIPYCKSKKFIEVVNFKKLFK